MSDLAKYNFIVFLPEIPSPENPARNISVIVAMAAGTEIFPQIFTITITLHVTYSRERYLYKYKSSVMLFNGNMKS